MAIAELFLIEHFTSAQVTESFGFFDVDILLENVRCSRIGMVSSAKETMQFIGVDDIEHLPTRAGDLIDIGIAAPHVSQPRNVLVNLLARPPL
jgi:hypothetical protein